jgi:phage/plasmid-like protein (TIGR03299 family)
MVAGKPAWHGLGVNVAAAVTSADAIRLAGLDWDVSKRAMSYRKNDGTYAVARGTFAVVRDDSEAHLGTVGARYQMIQHRDGLEFLDSVIGEFGAKFHTAGSIHGGAEVWMQCELPDHSFEVVRGDEVQAFALFTNPHDGSGKAWCFPTTNRVVCANTFRTASKDRSTGGRAG